MKLKDQFSATLHAIVNASHEDLLELETNLSTFPALLVRFPELAVVSGFVEATVNCLRAIRTEETQKENDHV